MYFFFLLATVVAEVSFFTCEQISHDSWNFSLTTVHSVHDISNINGQLGSASITADVDNGIAYISSSDNPGSGSLYRITIKDGNHSVVFHQGGSLRHIAYDYKDMGAGAPGKSLYGLWATENREVSLVLIDKETLNMTIITTLNTTGDVSLAYLGLPTFSPTPGDMGKHYAVVLTPAGKNPASGTLLIFIDLAGTINGWGYINSEIAMASLAMDYDTNNVYTTFVNRTDGHFYFGIIHMNGELQETIATIPIFFPHPLIGSTSIDMKGGVYYTVQGGQQHQSYLNGLNETDGSIITSLALRSTFAAIYFNGNPI